MTAPLILPRADHPRISAKAAHWIYLAASASAVGAGLLFLAGILGLTKGDNWLITIFKLLAGSDGIQPSQLYQLNVLDLALLVLIAIAHAGLYVAVHRSHRILAPIALVQPPLGILLFLFTHSAGRCAVMGAGFVISVTMLRGGPFTKRLGWIGLLSSALLLAGDLGTGMAPSSPLAISTALGCVLLIGWLLAVGRRLLQLAH